MNRNYQFRVGQQPKPQIWFVVLFSGRCFLPNNCDSTTTAGYVQGGFARLAAHFSCGIKQNLW
jgi:hypothetical protein